ncbi:unnamed protein product [Amoebophrya sp. A120]|nr:unnamed protein product [Amoebophrya sp. A120]|eukprot:GSA120T00023150001.1
MDPETFPTSPFTGVRLRWYQPNTGDNVPSGTGDLRLDGKMLLELEFRWGKIARATFIFAEGVNKENGERVYAPVRYEFAGGSDASTFDRVFERGVFKLPENLEFSEESSVPEFLRLIKPATFLTAEPSLGTASGGDHIYG